MSIRQKAEEAAYTACYGYSDRERDIWIMGYIDGYLEALPEEEEIEMCKCGNNHAETEHQCPYAMDINNDSTQCNCCGDCTNNCLMDI